MNDSEYVYDAVVIGGGLSGLAAAYALRDRNVLVLEMGSRPGGRIFSSARPPYWLNFGAHMFGAVGTPVGDLAKELHLEARPIRGSLIGMIFDGKRVLKGRPEQYPFVLPIPLKARLDFIRMGLKLRNGSNDIVRQMQPLRGETPSQTRCRIVSYNNDTTLSDFIGPLHPQVAKVLTAITERTGGDPSEMAAGYALRSFANVWSNHSPGNNLVGGSSLFPAALAERLDGCIRYDTRALGVQQTPDGVTIEAATSSGQMRFRAKQCVMAVPAFVAALLLDSIPADTRNALNSVRYGTFLTAAVLTKEKSAMPWDEHYAISTPGRSFSAIFNQATTLRQSTVRTPGGSLMLFRGARGGKELLQMNDTAIEDIFKKDLLATFPEASGCIAEIIVQRWEAGAPYSWPGRGKLQSALTRPLGRVVLAGDYLEFPNMEAALNTGFEAAKIVRGNLLETTSTV